MNKLFPFAFIFALFFAANLEAQIDRKLHQSFEIGDQLNITLAFGGDLEVESWAGNTILTETTLIIEGVSEAIIDYLINKGRYRIKMEESDVVLLRSEHTNKESIITKAGEVNEIVKVRIFVPENCTISTIDPTLLNVEVSIE